MYVILGKETKSVIDILENINIINNLYVEANNTNIQLNNVEIIEIKNVSQDIINNKHEYHYINDQFIKNYELYSLKLQKIEEMRSLCGYKIINEFYSTCKGESKRYDCESYDQLNISGMTNIAQLILLNFTNQTLMYKNSDQLICEEYTPQEIILLASDLKNHVESKLHRFDKLRLYILDDNRTKEELQNLIWDTENVI